MPRPSDDASANSPGMEHDQAAAAKDAPVSPQEAARKPPTREGGADAGQGADDPGRGGD